MLEALLDMETLSAAVTLVLGPPGRGERPRLLRREPNPYGDGRSEIVTLDLGGSELRLFCKYEDPGWANSAVAYEARVYREVLPPVGLSTLAYYGSGELAMGTPWLLLEYLEGAEEPDLCEEDAMVDAARWLGAFQAACARAFPGPPAFLTRYGPGYYAELLASAAGRDTVAELPWLGGLVERLPAFLEPLHREHGTIVHADFHLDNVLFRHGRVCPIDWEMAGVDLGETDLLLVFDGWSDEVERACVQAYRQARWPDGAPPTADTTLAAAKLCLAVYKLAADSDDDAVFRRRTTELRSLVEALELEP